tara:strand:+ start:532 stop:750 length:219 start_codon:yes stop_codon:yes gene_type:complete
MLKKQRRRSTLNITSLKKEVVVWLGRSVVGVGRIGRMLTCIICFFVGDVLGSWLKELALRNLVEEERKNEFK